MAENDVLSIGELTTAWDHYDKRLAVLDTLANESVFTNGLSYQADLRQQRESVARRRTHVEELLDRRLMFE